MQKLYEQYKGLLFTLAYQLTGSASDAEDAVQDVFMKLYDIELECLVEPKAYLCKMVTNRCLDILKSARKKREQYFGEWLPEPILTSEDESIELVVRGELLSYAMLVLLERLSPSERAAFVLREALGFEYSIIAELIGKSESNCRKMVSRARGKMGIAIEEPICAETASKEWVQRFLSALEQGNMDTVVSILAEDVTLIADGGGKAFTAVHPIHSRVHVAKFLFGLMRKVEGMKMEITEINGQIGLVIHEGDRIDTVVIMHFEKGTVHNLYFVRNPDKLRHL
ncbi:RNA polymerase sigma-70 factor [Neobacillus massiliamazoniensis]|nr:RNA polymerase sigma-70 factor [Neobacillus massiliamazoniensis]